MNKVQQGKHKKLLKGKGALGKRTGTWGGWEKKEKKWFKCCDRSSGRGGRGGQTGERNGLLTRGEGGTSRKKKMEGSKKGGDMGNNLTEEHDLSEANKKKSSLASRQKRVRKKRAQRTAEGFGQAKKTRKRGGRHGGWTWTGRGGGLTCFAEKNS